VPRFSSFSASPLGVDVRRAGDVALVAIAGEIDLSNAVEVRDALQTAVALGLPTTVVDLAGIDFIDSVGLGVLIGVRKRLLADGMALVLWRPSTVMTRTLGLTGLTGAFTIEPRVDLDPAELGPPAAPAVAAAPAAG
jgi:anti-sigma B factor antagonist